MNEKERNFLRGLFKFLSRACAEAGAFSTPVYTDVALVRSGNALGVALAVLRDAAEGTPADVTVMREISEALFARAKQEASVVQCDLLVDCAWLVRAVSLMHRDHSVTSDRALQHGLEALGRVAIRCGGYAVSFDADATDLLDLRR